MIARRTTSGKRPREERFEVGQGRTLVLPRRWPRERAEVVAPRAVDRGRRVPPQPVEVVDLPGVGLGPAAAPQHRVPAQPVAQRPRGRLLRADDQKRRQAPQRLLAAPADEGRHEAPEGARAPAVHDAGPRVHGPRRHAGPRVLEHEAPVPHAVLRRRRRLRGDAKNSSRGPRAPDAANAGLAAGDIRQVHAAHGQGRRLRRPCAVEEAKARRARSGRRGTRRVLLEDRVPQHEHERRAQRRHGQPQPREGPRETSEGTPKGDRRATRLVWKDRRYQLRVVVFLWLWNASASFR